MVCVSAKTVSLLSKFSLQKNEKNDEVCIFLGKSCVELICFPGWMIGGKQPSSEEVWSSALVSIEKSFHIFFPPEKHLTQLKM